MAAGETTPSVAPGVLEQAAKKELRTAEAEVVQAASSDETDIATHVAETQSSSMPETRSSIEEDRRTSSSPPPAVSPTLALDPCPGLDRSLSTASSSDSLDGRSTSSRLSDGGQSALSAAKRRGYMRPQATIFADSAKNRESVMSLGTIAHLQYYFARTGLLDGKGAQLAKEDEKALKLKKKRRASALLPPTSAPRVTPRAASMSVVETPLSSLRTATADTHFSSTPSISEYTTLVESPIEEEDGEGSMTFVDEDGEPLMLPPTVSTYTHRPVYVPPPPDLTTLRRELTEALESALQVLKESDKCPDDSQGWYELQGLHLLDITTLAIRAAKTYYTAHSNPRALYAIKSEREIRKELYEVLEILKKMAARNFVGGIRKSEKVGILTWIVGISEVIQREIEAEKKEAEKREKWSWRTGSWEGREREREHLFLNCFLDEMKEETEELPPWIEPKGLKDEELPTPFLQFWRNGLTLVLLHNECVRQSKRHFEEIRNWHTDFGKPYRLAENLRFWIKAAQLRWEVTLDVDVMGVVQGGRPEAWRKFDQALMKWCRAVREELTSEWEQSRSPGRKTPVLKVVTDSEKQKENVPVQQMQAGMEQLKI